MSETRKRTSALTQAALAVVGLPIIVAAIIWTNDMPDTPRGLILFGLFLAFTVAGVAADARAQRNLDEMDIAARSFGARWSYLAISLLASAALFLPPFQAVLEDLSRGLARQNDGPAGMFAMGAFASLLVKGVASTLLRTVWIHTKR